MQFVANVKIKTGRVVGPFGTEIRGFEVSLGGSPPEVVRSYEDIDKIFKANPGNYKVHEERENGKFKRFVVET